MPNSISRNLESAQKAEELRKVKADADQSGAETETEKARVKNEEYNSILSRNQREVEPMVVIGKANKDAADTRARQFSSLAPDLSRIDRGSLHISVTPVMSGPPVAPFEDIADKVAAKIADVVNASTAGGPQSQGMGIPLKREVRSFSDIVADARAAKEWLEDNGVATERTRFGSYLRDAEAVEKMWRIDYGAEQVHKKGIYPLLVSLSEADAIGQACRILGSQSPTQGELARKLKICIKGPVLPEDESSSTNSNQARNIFFELRLAAKCAQAGLRPALGESPDIRLRVNDCSFHIECKRVGSWNALKNGVRKAMRQLDASLARDRSAYGVIAFDVSKVAGLPDIAIARDPTEIEELLMNGRQEMMRHEHLLRASLDAMRNQRIIGMIFYFATLALNESSGRFGADFSLEAVPVSETIPADAKRALRAFVVRLNQPYEG